MSVITDLDQRGRSRSGEYDDTIGSKFHIGLLFELFYLGQTNGSVSESAHQGGLGFIIPVYYLIAGNTGT